MKYEVYTELQVEQPWYEGMCKLHDLVFGKNDSYIIGEELSLQRQFLILVTVHEGQVVGYKIGYQERTSRFYSWLGGVHPEFRNQGIAGELMSRQHNWCKSCGYNVIRTQTRNTWREMLVLNLHNGYDVVGTRTEQGETTILLEKCLSEDEDLPGESSS
ncbi:GNAT family N-acetyltransferase [Alicyclobacillus sp. ALC3]|uniref:GNAT family N-acetyltransferase n=1 Tax=Alicyclobacillus sp. ALC3 TaxID=2796143 RepID=UPI00237A0560|nr:GNAT family N-acetyltransferase [Alicyclobacillus sp. ALC3]WDL95905.1 GNAT family N-acetyltransferase [Alicyclobacillus sp. ALC3]